MKKLYLSYCTEYEEGWDSKPDGVMIAEDQEKMLAEIKKQHDKGSYEIFWRFTEPIEVYSEEENYNKLVSLLNDNGVSFYMHVSNLNLYKKII